MKYCILICARGGSKGIKNKNIKNFNGKPLLVWTLELANKLKKKYNKKIIEIIVSTDSKKIANLSLKNGALVPFLRPKGLAKDNSPEWKVWQHALKYLFSQNYQFESLIALSVTTPLKKIVDVERAISIFEKKKIETLITLTESYRNPYFNMIEIKNNKKLELVKSSKNIIFRRQDAPKIYDMVPAVYIVKNNFLLSSDNILKGKLGAYFIPKDRSIDIDTKFDFEYAQYIHKKLTND